MNAYTGFSSFYEEFMDNIPYEDWTKYIVSLLKKYGVPDGLVCELGCGTGCVTRLLRDAGYNMIGIDSSAEMLEVAMYEHSDENKDILYLNQDMTDFELYGTVNAIVCVCDSINYLLTEKDLVKTFKLCNNYLESRGILIFDMKTEYEYSVKMGNRTIVDNRKDSTLIWENSYNPKTHKNRYDITVYGKSDEDPDLFYRTDETHIQKAYSVSRVISLIEKAGMEFVAAYDAFTFDPVKETGERIYFVAREKKQEGKLYV